MEMVYPEHIYDENRKEVASDYVRHELRKYLPSVRGGVWKEIDTDIKNWFDGAPFLFPVRDFWNGVHGIMMGFKLYNQLLSFNTAENVEWKKEKINLEELSFGSKNPVLKDLMGDSWKVRDAMGIYEVKKDLRKKHLREVEEWYEKSEIREDHPIIVTQKQIGDEDKLVVYDGNGRTTLAVLRGQNTIPAHVGRFVDERRQPENYWLPTSILMEVVHFAKLAWKENKKERLDHYLKVLQDMLTWSESGKYEMRERVYPHEDEFKKILLTNLDL